MVTAPLVSSLALSLITRDNRVHGGGCLIWRTEDDDAGRFGAGCGENVPEIQIECEQALCSWGAFGDDIRIGKPIQTFFAEMHGVVRGRTQGLHGRDGHAMPDQKSHAVGFLKNPVSSNQETHGECS